MARNKRAVVFEAKGTLFAEPRFEGCVYGHTRRYVLGHGSGESRLYRLAGTMVAYVEHPSGGFSEKLKVENLINGVTPVSYPDIELVGRCRGGGRVLSLVLKEDGAFAWIGGCPPFISFEEHEFEPNTGRWVPGGRGEGLRNNIDAAERSNVDPSSLRLAGSTVYWTQEGQRHSAPLY